MGNNLLPPVQKKELEYEKLRKKILWLLSFGFFGFVILVFIVFGLYLFSSARAKNLDKEIANKEQQVKSSDFQATKEVINVANQNLYKISNIKKEQVSVAAALEQVEILIPSNVYLTNFSFQNSSRDIVNQATNQTNKEYFGKIKMSGVFAAREPLFTFKEAMATPPFFKDVYFDPSSWVKPKNGEFLAEFNFIPNVK